MASNRSVEHVVLKGNAGEAAQKEAERLADVEKLSKTTPHKSSASHRSDLQDMRRDTIDPLIEMELLRCRWTSPDLPDSVFGSIITVDLASAVLGYFLEKGWVTAQFKKKKRGKPIELAKKAADHYSSTGEAESKPSTRTRASSDGLTWKWNLWDSTPAGKKENKNEQRIASFLNAVAECSLEAIRHLKRQSELAGRQPLWLFCAMLDPNRPLPLSDDHERQQLKPDLLMLPLKAFPSAYGPTSPSSSDLEDEGERSDRIYHTRKRQRLTEFANPPDIPTAASASNESLLPSASESQERQSEAIVEDEDEFFSKGEEAVDVDDDDDYSSSSSDTVGHGSDFRPSDGAGSDSNGSDSPSPMPGGTGKKRRLSDEMKAVFGRLPIPSTEYAHWQQTRTAGEAKTQDMAKAFTQDHRYLRALRRAQPWLRFCLGLTFTGATNTDLTLGLLRTDSTGVEECTLKLQESRGALDIIRIALGFVLSTDEELGTDPSMHVIERTEQRGQTKFKGRSPKRVRVDHDAEATCSVSYMIFDAMSLRGRGTRVWAVKWDGTGDAWAAFSGTPRHSKYLALKLSWQPLERVDFEASVIARAKVKHDPQSVLRVLLPFKQWTANVDGDPYTTLGSIRGFAEKDWPKIGAECRVLQYSLTPCKRPLSAFGSLQEVVGALVDAIKGHEYLCSIGVLHRDISEDNIVLAVDADEGTRGYLMDLDMASKLPEASDKAIAPADPTEPRIGDLMKLMLEAKGTTAHGPHRTGTTPYMAVGVLSGETHESRHDLESVFYVLYLLLFSYDGPLPAGEKPGSRVHTRVWPDKMQDWNRDTFEKIAAAKTFVMTDLTRLIARLYHAHTPYFSPNPTTYRGAAIIKLLTVFYGEIWPAAAVKRNIVHADVCRVLEQWLTSFPDKDWNTPLGFKPAVATS